jgi:pyruvate/2-oxoglutarate dehydrogenase complex dihydrolipoamide dehydrogenase (E3) component
MARYDYNLIVIGGGSAGLIAALIGATVNARVALVEREKMGGDCLNTGCVPSKSLLRAARAAHEMRTAERFGIAGVEPEVDFEAVMARVQSVIAAIEPKDSVERYAGLGVDCFIGDAVLEDGHHVRVTSVDGEADGEQRLSGRAIVLATGAAPFVPPIPGLREIDPLTSDTVWALKSRPKSLLVMGGGPIGCELAQAFARLGSEVTLIDMADRLLPREDPETSELLAARFQAEGIDVRLSHKAVKVTAGEGRAGVLTALAGNEPDGEEVSLPFDEILVAVGRAARGGAGLEAAGIARNPDGTIRVDAHLRTSLPSVYACGDAAGPYQFTHMASHQAWCAAVNGLIGRFRKFKVNYAVVPWATYTDPEVARVGLSEAEAAAEGIAVEVVRYGLDDLDRALAEGDAEGWVKVLVKPGTDKILGAQIVGAEAGELIGEFVLAMTHGLGLKKIMSTIHIYPTRMEAVKFSASTWRKAHAPEGLLRLAGKLLALLR